MNNCIPKNLVQKVSDQIDEQGLESLYDMPKSERIAFFSKHLDNATAKTISSSFDTVLAESKRTALLQTFKSLGIKDEEVLKKLKADTKRMSVDDLLNPAKDTEIFTELSNTALGINATPEEIKKITEIGTRIEKNKAIIDTVPAIKNGEFNDAYKKAYIDYSVADDEMFKYILQNTKISKSDTFMAHSKAMMLLKPASFAVNIISTALNTGFDAVARRVGTLRLGGYGDDVVREWKKTMAEIYNKTGADYSRSLDFEDMMTGRGKLYGEKTAGEGVAKDTLLTKTVYKWGLGSPDAFFSRLSFGDSANLRASSMADSIVKESGLTGAEARDAAKKKAGEILADAFNVTPRTEEGRAVREFSVGQAMHSTYTDDSWANDLASGMKMLINKIPGGKTLRYADWIEPFVKTNANIINQGLKDAGLGALTGSVDFIRYIRNKNIAPDVAQKYLIDAASQLTRTGSALVGGYFLAKGIGEDNYMGAYDPRRSKYEQLRNSNYNAIRLGDKWYSLDFVGPFAIPLVAALEAQSYKGGKTVERIYSYIAGGMKASTKLPFIGSIPEAVNTYEEGLANGEKALDTSRQWFTEQVAARVPGILSDIARLTDDEMRDITTGKYKALGINLDPIVSKFPLWASSLPEKRNLVGETIKTEPYAKEDAFAVGMLSTMLAGARIKTEQSSPSGKEIYRLYDAGYTPTITNWRYPQGKKLKELKEKVGNEEFGKIFINEYSPAFRKRVEKLLNNEKYQKLSDEYKKKYVDKAEDDVMKLVYQKYGIK